MRTRNVKIISNETLIKQKSNSENVFLKKKTESSSNGNVKEEGEKN